MAFLSSWRRYAIWLAPVMFLAALYGYGRAGEALGGFKQDRFFEQWLELALAIYIYVYFYAILKPGRWRGVLAGAPLVLLYLAGDIYFHFYGKVLRIIEVMELPELIQVLPLSYSVPVLAVYILPLFAFFISIDYRRVRVLILGALPLMVIVYLVEGVPQAYATLVETSGNEIVKWSDSVSVENNGRLTMLLYREAQRASALAATRPYRQREAYERDAAQFAATLNTGQTPPDVHVIVLESFLDPTMFKGASFSRDPVHPEFRKLFGGNLGLSISPVFGGATAQAEFEVLCGVPAFEKLSSVEFNLFTGRPAECMPGLLARAGYRTVASNAYKPNFFNAQPGYKGTGFQEIYFPREFFNAPTYLRVGEDADDGFLFDRSLFEQNLEFVAAHRREHPGQPLFNYIMTVYGHTPHIIDTAKRPEVTRVLAAHQDEHLQRVVNQFYYRGQAIAEYVRKLSEMDPGSLIILVGDHVPPLVYGPITYRELRYLDNIPRSDHHTRLMVAENGAPRRYNVIHHYEIHDVVYDFLTGGAYCANNECPHLNPQSARPREHYLERYLRLMAHASE